MKTVTKTILLLCSLLQKKLMTTTAYDPLWPTTPISSPSYSRRPVPSQMYDSLTAADIDDNLNYETYQIYAHQSWNENDQLPNPDEWLTHRISVQVTDENGNPFSGATVHVQGEEEEHAFTTGSDGKLAIFPQIDLDDYDNEQLYFIHASNGLVASDATLFFIVDDDSSDDDIAVNLVIPTTTVSPTEMDLALVLDTTGSMCDELDFLKQELEHVLMEFTESITREEDINVRIALVFYKDDEIHNDSYVVSHSDFDSNRETVMEHLRQEICGGGGDYPEAVHAAWEQATELSWRRPEDDNTNGNVVRVALLIGDAPPRSEHIIDALESALQLREWGVRMYGLAASDTNVILEYLLRMVAVLSHGRHLWLTNDSLIGLDRNDATTVACFQVTELKSLLIRILVGEMEGRRIEIEDEVDVVREVGSQDDGICLYDMNGNDPILQDSTNNFGSKVSVIDEGDREGAWSDVFITIDEDDPPTTDAPTDGAISKIPSCFSGENMVTVKNVGLVAMKNLKLGDEVLVDANGKYSKIYSFGHYHPSSKEEYLQIYTNDGLHHQKQPPLEISPDHLVFVIPRRPIVSSWWDEQPQAIPAFLVVPGDRILVVDGATTAISTSLVQHISRVTRYGKFAPFTFTGTIVVNGVVASNYITLLHHHKDDDRISIFLGDTTTAKNKITLSRGKNTILLQSSMHHWLAHSFQAYHRTICYHFPSFCTKETYTKDGISNWVRIPLACSEWVLLQVRANSNNNSLYGVTYNCCWIIVLTFILLGTGAASCFMEIILMNYHLQCLLLLLMLVTYLLRHKSVVSARTKPKVLKTKGL